MFTTKKGTAAARNYGYRLADALVAAIEADAKSTYQIAKDAGIRESDLLQFLGGTSEPYTRHQATISLDVAASIAAGLSSPGTIEISPFDLYVQTSGGDGLAGATEDAAYSDYVEFVNAAGRTKWRISNGSLPPGLSIDTGSGSNQNRGLITGTPTDPSAGTYNFTVEGTDDAGVKRTLATSIVVAAD